MLQHLVSIQHYTLTMAVFMHSRLIFAGMKCHVTKIGIDHSHHVMKHFENYLICKFLADYV